MSVQTDPEKTNHPERPIGKTIQAERIYRGEEASSTVGEMRGKKAKQGEEIPFYPVYERGGLDQRERLDGMNHKTKWS